MERTILTMSIRKKADAVLEAQLDAYYKIIDSQRANL